MPSGQGVRTPVGTHHMSLPAHQWNSVHGNRSRSRQDKVGMWKINRVGLRWLYALPLAISRASDMTFACRHCRSPTGLETSSSRYSLRHSFLSHQACTVYRARQYQAWTRGNNRYGSTGCRALPDFLQQFLGRGDR
jgi:hypothetical protein